MRVAGRRPHLVVALELGVDQGAQRLRVADRRDAADGEAGVLADEVGTGAVDRGGADSAATLAVSTRWPPEAITSSGAPSASKTSELAIWATSTPSCSAAWAAVRAAPSRVRTCPPAPSSASRAVTRTDAGMAVHAHRD